MSPTTPSAGVDKRDRLNERIDRVTGIARPSSRGDPQYLPYDCESKGTKGCNFRANTMPITSRGEVMSIATCE